MGKFTWATSENFDGNLKTDVNVLGNLLIILKVLGSIFYECRAMFVSFLMLIGVKCLTKDLQVTGNIVETILIQ